MVKQVYLSRHAKRRMRLHDISLEHVLEVLRDPAKVDSTIRGRYNAFKRIGQRFIRVTYKEEEMRYVIITVTPRRQF